LSDKITISDPALWAYALKKGFSVSDVSLHLDAGEYEAWEVAGAFQRAGVSNSIITEFLVANEKHISLSDWDVERLSRSSLSDDQVAQIIRALGHPALQLQPSSVARLKARGMDDETILALTREKSLGLSRPVDSQHHGPYRIGGDVSAPVLISKVEPEYSGQARRACLSGAMSLSLVVDSNGIPRDIYVIKPLGMGLNEKAVEAVMKWRFRPGMKGGQPVATWATVEINFRLFGPCQEQPVSQSVDLLSPTNHSTNSISSSQPFSSALPGKRYRDRGEYELFSKVTTTSDPLARLETLYSWENQYRQSDYLNERLQYFVATLAKLAPSNSVLRGSLIQRCNELLKIDPSSFQASYALAFWGPTEGGSHPSPELVAQIKTAAQNITSKVDAIFGSAKIPATVSQAELVNTKSQAVTAAQKALAYVKQVQSDKREISITSGSDLQVEIVQVNWSTSEWGTSGFGKGNLLGNQSKQGFDFAFTCSRPFLPSEGGGYYPGKWKKPNSRLVILTTEIGNAKKHDSCELKVSLEPYAYEVRNSPLTTVPIR